MNKLILGALAMALTIGATAPAAQAQDGGGHGDRRQEILKRFDKNGDGKLDATERKAAREAMKRHSDEKGKKGKRSGDRRKGAKGKRGGEGDGQGERARRSERRTGGETRGKGQRQRGQRGQRRQGQGKQGQKGGCDRNK